MRFRRAGRNRPSQTSPAQTSPGQTGPGQTRPGGITAAVASYSGSGMSLNAAAGVLTGRLRPRGRLPVAIPAVAGGMTFRYGTGLSY